MNNNQIVAAGINQINEGNQKSVVSTATGIITQIVDAQARIASRKETNEHLAENLKELEHMDVNYRSITGQDVPATPNMNQQTILKTLEEINKTEQKNVANRAAQIADSVRANSDAIKKDEKYIAELRERLAKLSVEVVSASDIVGSN